MVLLARQERRREVGGNEEVRVYVEEMRLQAPIYFVGDVMHVMGKIIVSNTG